MHSELVALTSACLASSLCSWRKYQCRRLLSSLELLVRAAGSYRPVWEISNTAAVMVFAQMRTLSIGAACEFTRGSEHFAPLPSQSRVTRRGWLASLSLSSFFLFRPPSSRPSPAASDCLGPAGATLTAKTDHVSWRETKPKGYWQPQNYLNVIFSELCITRISPIPRIHFYWCSKTYAMEIVKLWDRREEENLEGHTFHEHFMPHRILLRIVGIATNLEKIP